MRDTKDKEIRQEWLMPVQAAKYCGVSRALIHAWMNKGLIRNCALRQRGQIRATRLISFDSLRDFLESQAKGGGQVAE